MVREQLDIQLHTSEDRPRLTQALFAKSAPRFASFTILPSNARAVESAALFSCGLTPFVAIVGPSGWGKSHLLQSVCTVLKTERGGMVSVVPAKDWLTLESRADLSAPLLLDDIQEAWESPRCRHYLRMWLERRVRAGRPTMVSVENSRFKTKLRQILPQIGEWTVCEVGCPSKQELIPLIIDVADTLGMTLGPDLVSMMARRLSGNGRTLRGALQKLQCLRTEWTTADSVVQACGVLQPYCYQAGGSDLRDDIAESIQSFLADLNAEDPSVQRDMTIYAMRTLSGLGEWQVADYFYDTPGSIYAAVQRVELGPMSVLATALRNDWVPKFAVHLANN